jgi:hypothetical protein
MGGTVSGPALQAVLTQGGANPLTAGEWNSTPIGNVYESTGGALGYIGDGGLRVRGTDNSDFLVSAAQQFIANNVGNLDAIRAGAAAKGLSDDDVRRIAAGAGITLPGYDVGTWRVPETGPAILHQDEIVLPAPHTRRVRADMPSGAAAAQPDAVVRQLQLLRAEVQSLRIVAAEGARGTISATQQVVENTAASRQAAFLVATAV